MNSPLGELPPEPLDREATGSDEVLEEVVGRVTPSLARLARVYRIPEHEIEDLLQTVWLVAWRKRERIENLGAWARETMRNRCLMYWRSKRIEQRMTDVVGEAQEVEEELTASSAQRWESRVDLGRVLLGLPREQRRAVMLYVAHGLSAREVAERTGHSEANVRQMWRRVRGRLRESLGGEVEPAEVRLDG